MIFPITSQNFERTLMCDFRNYLMASVLIASLTSCITMPPDAFQMPKTVLAQRQIESREFVGISEEKVLVASSNALQDMGFNLENSEVKLGVITAQKQRDAHEFKEIVGAVVLAALGVNMPISKSQTIRVSLVVKPAGNSSVIGTTHTELDTTTSERKKQSAVVVRVKFHRVVTKTDNNTYLESIKDKNIYQAFFDKLSKSIFIEAQEI